MGGLGASGDMCVHCESNGKMADCAAHHAWDVENDEILEYIQMSD